MMHMEPESNLHHAGWMGHLGLLYRYLGIRGVGKRCFPNRDHPFVAVMMQLCAVKLKLHVWVGRDLRKKKQRSKESFLIPPCSTMPFDAESFLCSRPKERSPIVITAAVSSCIFGLSRCFRICLSSSWSRQLYSCSS